MSDPSSNQNRVRDACWRVLILVSISVCTIFCQARATTCNSRINTVAFHFLTPAPNVYNNSPTSDPLVPCIEPDADSNTRICPGNGLLEDMDLGSADLNTSKVFAWNREVSIAFTFAATQVNQVNLFFYNIPSSGVGLPPAELYWSDTNAALPEIPLSHAIVGNQDLSQDDRTPRNVSLVVTGDQPQSNYRYLRVRFTFPAETSLIEWILLSEVHFCEEAVSLPMDSIAFLQPRSFEPPVPPGPDSVVSATNLSCTVANEGSFQWQWTLPPGITFTQMWLADGTRTSIVQISQISAANAGNYTCTASFNGQSAANTTAVQLDRMLASSPNTTVTTDSSATLSCELYGYLPEELPTIVWNFGGDQLTDDSVFTITTEDGSRMIQNGGTTPRPSVRSLLTINRPNTTHKGAYFCSASGRISRIDLQVAEAVTDPPPSSPTSSPTFSPTLTMTTPPFEGLGSEQTQFQVPVSAGVIAGGVVAAVTALLLCIGGGTVAIVYWRRKQHATSNHILSSMIFRDKTDRKTSNAYNVPGNQMVHDHHHSYPDTKDFSQLIISSNSIRLLNIIGQGEFGVVYKAHLVTSMQQMPDVVAVKTLKGFFDETRAADIMRESVKMQGLNHPNVLHIIGLCVDPVAGLAPYIIMPFMANGSLLSYIRKDRSKLVVPIDTADSELTISAHKLLADMCIQIAKGMAYLAEKGIVHRDLAARNCMIDIHSVIKVADFGLSESMYSKTYFRQEKNQSVKLPVKWLSPEALTEGVFSEKSDVWSYGVTCWELFTGGRIPYPGVDPVSLPSLLESGHRLEKPNNAACCEESYLFMFKCWHMDPDERPIFSELVSLMSQKLGRMAGYMDVSTLDECMPLNSDTEN